MSDGLKPQRSAEKSLGRSSPSSAARAASWSVRRSSSPKRRCAQKASRLTRGIGFFAAAGVLAVYLSFFFFVFLALGLDDWLNLRTYVGFAIITIAFLLLTGVLALLGMRAVKRGAPPTPELAIEEAKKTRAAHPGGTSLMAGRNPQEIRASVEATREELEYSLVDLQSKVAELSDWRAQLTRHRKQVLIGAAVAGFVLGGGIAAVTGLFRN